MNCHSSSEDSLDTTDRLDCDGFCWEYLPDRFLPNLGQPIWTSLKIESIAFNNSLIAIEHYCCKWDFEARSNCTRAPTTCNINFPSFRGFLLSSKTDTGDGYLIQVCLTISEKQPEKNIHWSLLLIWDAFLASDLHCLVHKDHDKQLDRSPHTGRPEPENHAGLFRLFKCSHVQAITMKPLHLTGQIQALKSPSLADS